MSQKIISLVARTDKALAGLEDKAIQEMNLALIGAYKSLEKKLLATYPKYTSEAKPGLLANQRSLLLFDELKSVLGETLPKPIVKKLEQTYTDVLSAASEEGLTLSDELMKLRGGSDFVTATANVPIEVIAQAAKEAATLVVGKSNEFKKEARFLITQGLAMGAGGAKVARQLRQRLGVAKGRAEAIARTEINRAQNNAAKANYKANGIGYFQSIATADGRLCPYCGDRNGKVYRLDEAQIPYHVRCRCYAAPFSPEWQDEKLTSDKWIKDFYQEGVDILADKGVKLINGPTYFERKAGMNKAPKAVWSPKRGFITTKKKLLALDKTANRTKQSKNETQPKKKAKKKTINQLTDAELVGFYKKEVTSLRSSKRELLAQFQKQEIDYAKLTEKVKTLEDNAQSLLKKLRTTLSKRLRQRGKTDELIKRHGMSDSEIMTKTNFNGIDLYASSLSSNSAAVRSVEEMVLDGWFPEAIARHTKFVVFSEQRNKDDFYWEKKYKTKGFVSAATGGGGGVVIYNGKSASHSTIAHEMGHNLANYVYKTASPPKGSDFEKATRVREEPTDYAKSSIAEDFAESVSLYIMHQNDLLDGKDFDINQPERFTVIDRLAKEEENYNG